MATSEGDTSASASGLAPLHSSWSDIPHDIISLVLNRLNSVSDRARLRSVCRSWHDATRLHPSQVPPHPLLVYPDFTFDSPFTNGVTATVRQMPLPQELFHSEFPRCLGCFDGWLVCAGRGTYGMNVNGGVLMNPFSSVTYPLPKSDASHDHLGFEVSVPVINGDSVVMYSTVFTEPKFLHSLVMSASPDSASSCIIAAIFQGWNGANLALCQLGMTSWCMCVGNCISMPSDIEFYNGTLYMLSNGTADLFAFVLGVPNGRIPVIHRIEHCEVEKLNPSDSHGCPHYNLVQSCGKLLLLVRYSIGSLDLITQVKIFALDFSTNPYRWREIKSLDGESIFISSCSRKSFTASRYDRMEDDHVYFVDPLFRCQCQSDNNRNDPFLCYESNDSDDYHLSSIVYNMRDGTIKQSFLGRPLENWGYPIWFFPSI